MTTRDFIFYRLEGLYCFYRHNFPRRYSNHIRRHLGRTAVDSMRPSARRAGKVTLRTLEKLERHAIEMGFRNAQSSELEASGVQELRCPACRARLRAFFTLPPITTGHTPPTDATKPIIGPEPNSNPPLS